MNPCAKLAFLMGVILKDYDARYFDSDSHIVEHIDFHIARLRLNPAASDLDQVKRIAIDYFRTHPQGDENGPQD